MPVSSIDLTLDTDSAPILADLPVTFDAYVPSASSPPTEPETEVPTADPPINPEIVIPSSEPPSAEINAPRLSHPLLGQLMPSPMRKQLKGGGSNLLSSHRMSFGPYFGQRVEKLPLEIQLSRT